MSDYLTNWEKHKTDKEDFEVRAKIKKLSDYSLIELITELLTRLERLKNGNL